MFSDNRKINLNLEPKPAVVPERYSQLPEKRMKKTFILLLAFSFLNFESKKENIIYPNKKQIIVEEFTNFENILPLATIDFSEKGIQEKIHIIFISFNYDGKENDENFPKGESMGNYTYKIQKNGKYQPTFSKNVLKIESKYKTYFLKSKEKFDAAKSTKKNVLSIIEKQENPEWWQNDATPTNSKGQKFKFVCQFEMGDFIGDDCCVYVFYDKTDREVKYIHQYD